jgi:hypothetical protein
VLACCCQRQACWWVWREAWQWWAVVSGLKSLVHLGAARGCTRWSAAGGGYLAGRQRLLGRRVWCLQLAGWGTAAVEVAFWGLQVLQCCCCVLCRPAVAQQQHQLARLLLQRQYLLLLLLLLLLLQSLPNQHWVAQLLQGWCRQPAHCHGSLAMLAQQCVSQAPLLLPLLLPEGGTDELHCPPCHLLVMLPCVLASCVLAPCPGWLWQQAETAALLAAARQPAEPLSGALSQQQHPQHGLVVHHGPGHGPAWHCCWAPGPGCLCCCCSAPRRCPHHATASPHPFCATCAALAPEHLLVQTPGVTTHLQQGQTQQLLLLQWLPAKFLPAPQRPARPAWPPSALPR